MVFCISLAALFIYAVVPFLLGTPNAGYLTVYIQIGGVRKAAGVMLLSSLKIAQLT